MAAIAAIGGVSLVPAGPGVVVSEIDFRPGSLIDRPQPALPDERARRLVLHGPHRMAKLAFHSLALPDDAPGSLHRGDWSGGQKPADLGVGDHREPRAGIAGLEGADNQACCLKPRTHDQIISVGTPKPRTSCPSPPITGRSAHTTHAIGTVLHTAYSLFGGMEHVLIVAGVVRRLRIVA